uniref:Reverse transcriptase domain-containing protein n=1 Tax=Eptatretus burgeri TaxID=7764 RepID=A0A8C4Q754_EPTBU
MCEESVRGQSITCGRDSHSAYMGTCALHCSKPILGWTAVRAEGGGLLTEESKVTARWAGYFEQLYQTDPPAVELDVRSVTIPIADPPMNCDSPSFVETQTVVNWLKWSKAPGICGIYAELLKAGGNAVLVSLHAVLSLLATVRCDDAMSDLFPVVTGVRQGCALAPTLFSTCMDWILGRMSERSSCGASFGNVKISDLNFADDAVIFAETLDILLGALDVLNWESEPLGLQVSWAKTKFQAFNDILDTAILFVPVCDEDVEVRKRFTSLGSDIHVSAG